MATTLSDQKLGELLRLVEDADSVELKLTVPDSDRATAAGALGLDPLDAEIRQVCFFDTPDLSVSKGGVVGLWTTRGSSSYRRSARRRRASRWPPRHGCSSRSRAWTCPASRRRRRDRRSSSPPCG
jgi:hypothetical protein